MPTKHPRVKVTLPPTERVLLRAISLRATSAAARFAEGETARVPESECIRQMIRDTAHAARLSAEELKQAEADLQESRDYAALD